MWIITKITLFLHLLILPYSSITFALNPSNSNLTAYEVLEEYDFPIGILPNGVSGYELNSTTGVFKAYLNSTCTFTIDSYALKYKPTITGFISTDALTSLTGVYVKIYWFWLSIVKVTRDDDELVFSVGVASADFPVSGFDESPTCGCGFDCDTTNENDSEVNKDKKKTLKIRVQSLVSSS
ncbi:hypothetical protein V2J09_016076 [Rumex salicifolius]